MDLRKFKPGVIAKSAPRATDDEIISYDTSQAPFWTIHPDGGKPIRYAKKGIASEAGAKAFTIIEVWKSFLDKKGDLLAMATEWPTPQLSKETGQAPPPLPLNEWKSWNWKQYYDETASISKLIVSVGFAPLDAVIVYGFNSPYWFMGFLSGILAGGKGSGIYPSDSKEQVVYKTVHGKGSVIFLESAKLLEMYQSTIDELPYIKAIIVWTPSSSPLPESITRSDGSVVKVYSWETAAEEGKKLDGAVLDERAKNVQPHHCAALIYTSGTTGNPKAVMISHDNILFESRSVLLTCCPFFGENSTDRERCISYLPLSHVAGLLVDVFLPMLVSAFRPGSSATYFARPYDLKIGSLGARIKAVRPTSFIGVPRVWEKFADKIKEIGAQTKGLKKQIAAWAKAKGLKYHEARQIGGSASTPFMFGTAEKIVLSKVKAAIGLDQCKFAFTGAAPIMLETLQYFGSLGLNINEVYGMSECCGASTWSVDECHLWGTVGFPLPGTEVKIFKVDEKDINKKTECPDAKDPFKATDAEQGEICFRGRHIMLGYLANPDLGEEHVQEIMKKNREAIDDDGWLHSGDMGCKSKTGMIKITGRYKELIIGAGGENIAPVPIEDYLKQICKPISNAVMVGNQRKFNVLLVTLKAKGATGELPGTDDLDGPALDVDKECTKISQAVKSKAFIQLITAAIKETNENGAVCPSNAARIQKFTILPNDFSVQNEEITPSLKLKRGFVEKKYKDLIDKMMDSEEVYVPFS